MLNELVGSTERGKMQLVNLWKRNTTICPRTMMIRNVLHWCKQLEATVDYVHVAELTSSISGKNQHLSRNRSIIQGAINAQTRLKA